MMQTTLLILLFVSEINSAILETHPEPLSDELITYINNKPGVTWKAEKSSRFKNLDDMRRLLGSLKEPSHSQRFKLPTVNRDLTNVYLPESFDAREHWPHCKTIGKIRDQSSCGSCWAFGATGSMSDRICIHSNGTINVDLSVRDLISCCKDCGAGCDGGYSNRAWRYWISEGIVTGGTLEDNLGCEPYPFPACDHTEQQHSPNPYPKCPQYTLPTPECQRTCVPGYNQTYHGDKIFGKSAYYVNSNAEQIMMEIMKNGPVEASFSVYADFANYRSGIYHHTLHFYVGSHAVRIVGWGKEAEVPYWIVANSWNDQWGENGFFRIVRGRDECAIESSVLAGLPQV